MDRLSSSELLSEGSRAGSTSNDSASAWLSSYANDLYQHPAKHVPELAGLVAVAGVGTVIASRKVIGETIRAALAEVGAKSVVSDTAPRAAKPVAETFFRMHETSVRDALRKIEARDGVEIVSWGTTKIEGSEGAGLSVLRASDLGALQIKKGADTVYAHKISISGNGDTIASYYTNSPMNLKNPWVADENLAWPLRSGGPFDGLKKSGVEVLDLTTKPRGLHFNTKFDSLSVKWADLRAIAEPGSKAANSIADSTGLLAGKPNSFSSIEIRGLDAVTKGEGQLTLNPLKNYR